MRPRKLVWCVVVVVLAVNLVMVVLLDMAAVTSQVLRGLRLVPLTPPDTQEYETVDDMDAISYEECGAWWSQEEYLNSLDPSRGLLDASRTFKTHPFISVGGQWTRLRKRWQVCLSTQTSADRLFWVGKQAKVWKGLVSVAVFAPGTDYTVALVVIRLLQGCFVDVRDRVSFHISYPAVMPPKRLPISEEMLFEFQCENLEYINKELIRRLRSGEFSKTLIYSHYPRNLLRNIAQQGCDRPYTLATDIDMIAIPGLSEELNTFLSLNETQQCTKCAFIIPTYEIKGESPYFPRNKVELLALLQRGLAQRFHKRVFAASQSSSKLGVWEAAGVTERLQVLYNITTWTEFWEPIYVARGTVPPYDERFKGYGFTRNSQVLEMNLAGYRWYMLSNIFLTHRGFQTRYRSKSKMHQVKANYRRFQVFRRELLARYHINESTLGLQNYRQNDSS